MELVPASGFSLRELSSLFARCFEGYLVPVPDRPELLDQKLRCEQVSLLDSRVGLLGGEPVALALVARRARESRVALAGVAASHRGRRLGEVLMREVMEGARARGDRGVLLECFEENGRALRLYERLGFRRIRRLVGFEGELSPAAAALEEADPLALAAQLPGGLPWQLAGATVAALASPARALRLGRAWAAVGEATGEVLPVRTIWVEPGARGRGEGRRLLAALAAAYPGRRIAIPSVVPEGLADGFFAALGVGPAPLAQVELRWTP